MVRLLILLSILCICSAVLAFQAGKAVPVAIASGQISKRITGTLGTSGSATYTVSVKEGQTLVVNSVGTTSGFQVIATVKAPNGSMDGDKGVPNYDEEVDQTGTYTITVSRNLMASTANKGSFLLEVVVY